MSAPESQDSLLNSRLVEPSGSRKKLGFRSVASLLISRIVVLAAACMLLFGSVHAWVEFRHSQSEFQGNMTLLAENSLRLLSNALWDIEQEQVREQVAWLGLMPQVGYVRVTAQLTGETFTSGSSAAPTDPATIALPIMPPANSSAASASRMGLLEIWANQDYYLDQTRNSTTRVIWGYLLFTLLICLVVGWVMRRELRQPLRQIARFAANLKPNELGRPLELERPHRDKMDEIDLVIQGFQHLQNDLRHYIEHLDTLVAERTGQLESLVAEVKRMSLMDALTGCYNRRAIEERLPSEIQRCERYNRPLSVIFADVDFFKKINDVHGHTVGDSVLREVADRCQKHIRSTLDWIARYGGEEFLIVLPESDLEGATQLARRLLMAINASPIEVDGLALHVTASFGVTQFRSQDSLERMLARADGMLYQAKAEGRNCIRSAPHLIPI